ncbi:MAG TPA: hypothetical protein VM711_04245 [Sphingomicrobium sp.]|jgi:hypothetical protein|nr:hypothetical protein [Sphingomicrobium sp.]
MSTIGTDREGAPSKCPTKWNWLKFGESTSIKLAFALLSSSEKGQSSSDKLIIHQI